MAQLASKLAAPRRAQLPTRALQRRGAAAAKVAALSGAACIQVGSAPARAATDRGATDERRGCIQGGSIEWCSCTRDGSTEWHSSHSKVAASTGAVASEASSLSVASWIGATKGSPSATRPVALRRRYIGEKRSTEMALARETIQNIL